MNVVRVWKINLQDQDELLTPVLATVPLASLNSTAQYLPQGVYTTFRTYQHSKVFELDAHFQRLEESASLVGYALQLDRLRLRLALTAVAAQYPLSHDLRFRLVIDLEKQPGTFFVACELLQTLPPEAYRQGVRAITYQYQRLNPAAKSTQILQNTGDVRARLVGDINEALLVDEQGLIREGLSSNFFAVREGALWTAGEGVLPGMTRQAVLDLAQQARIQVVLKALAVPELNLVQEAFITSTSRGVLPVRQVDDWVIGAGRSGPLTQRLAERYEAFLLQTIEEIQP